MVMVIVWNITIILYLTISHCCQKGHESQKSQHWVFALEKHITIIANYVPSLPLLHHCTISTVTNWNARFDERLRNSYYSGVPSRMIINQPNNLRVTHHPSDSHHSINSYLNWPNSPALRFQSYISMSYHIERIDYWQGKKQCDSLGQLSTKTCGVWERFVRLPLLLEWYD